MPTTSIKISQLDPISSLAGSDFFPIDQSSSLKTYRSSLTQLQNLFSTGSFTGSFSGSFFGLGSSPQFIGTSSWAISSSRSISSSYSDFSNTSSFSISSSRSITASYALNSAGGDLSGAGTNNYLAIWSGSNKILGDSVIYYGTPLVGYPGYVSNANIYIQRNTPFLYVTGSGQASVVVAGDYNSSLSVANAVTTSNAWVLVVSGDGEDALSPGVKGGLDWSTYTSNSLFSSRQPTVTAVSQDVSRMMRVKSSGVYFWPLSSVQSLSKDSTFNIGVDSGTQNTTTRFLIDVYSGSNASNPVINHVQKAIEVRYGSSSLSTTFCVSSSGQVTAAGYSGSNFNAVSFYGSASYAQTASYVDVQLSNGFAKAWVNFGPTGVITSSYNVSTVTRHSIGDYTVNFSSPSPFSNANYVMLGSANTTVSTNGNVVYNTSNYTKTTSAVRIFVYRSEVDNLDDGVVNLVFFG